MTTLKDTLFSRGAKACFAVLLAASLVPVSALSSATAFAEDIEDDATGFTTEVSDARALTYNAADSGDDADESAFEERTSYAATEGDIDLGEGIESSIAAPENTDSNANGTPLEEPAAIASAAEAGTVTDIQLESLETTVEDTDPFSFFAPFRLLFGAASNGFTVPLKNGNYEKWIDRLDLSGAVDANGTNYAQTFYNILAEACDNDGTADWLIDWGEPVTLDTSSQVGGVYQVPKQPDGTVGILATIIENNDATNGSTSLTATEERVKEYINESYGAFDRDYPTSFWRDIQFGTVFWRPDNTNQSYCIFVLKSTSTTTPLDVRAQGYRTPDDIRAGIATLNERVSFIKAEYAKSDLAAQKSDYSRVKFYNEWLCENNEYNTSFPHIDQNANPDVWSAMSALVGRKGNVGPVCEGYSRAMKVLCDSDGIGCVLVDGHAPKAGPHMWNYVRMGSNWYGVDVTWNDSGAGESSANIEQYLLKGSQPFETTHPATNQFVPNGTEFINGPQLAAQDYSPNAVTFAGAITGLGPFAYGDEFALAYDSTTEGDVTYEVVSGPATKTDSTTPAEAASNGRTTLTITGTGDITVKVTLTPTAGGNTLTDTITITAGPRPLKTSDTVLAEKVYDGTVKATVVTPGSLVSARTEPSYAANIGVLDADKTDIGVNLRADSAAFLNANAAEDQAAVVTYELVSPSGNNNKLRLYTLEGHETENTTGTISKRPVTAYFALTSTRVLTSENLPTGTVRFEAASGDRGKLDTDNLQPANPTIQMTGMPSSMPTDIATGTSRSYNVTWTAPSTSLLTEIAKNPAAANYNVSLSANAAENTVVLTILNLESTSVLPAENPTSGALYRVECRIDGINNETTDALKDSGFTSAEDIVAKLLESLSGQTTKTLSADRTAVYDMTLYVQDDKGAWVPATADNFPPDGVRVTIAYPENTKGDTHSFYAAHMFTHNVVSGGSAHQPGEIETPQVLNGPDGMFFTLMGFSPVSVAWEDVPRNTQNAAGQGTGTTSQVGQSNMTQTGASNVSQTGDSLPVMGITVVALACIVLIVALAVRRNRQKDNDDKSKSIE